MKQSNNQKNKNSYQKNNTLNNKAELENDEQTLNEVSNNNTKKLSKKENFLQTLKFVLFSASAGIIQILAFTLLSSFVFKDGDNEYGWSYFIALILSVLWNFTLNRQFTFKSANNVPLAMLKVALFYLVFTPLSTWGGQVLSNHGWNEFLILAITMILNMVLEFLYCKFVVYRNSINTNKLAKKQQEKQEQKRQERQVKTEQNTENNN